MNVLSLFDGISCARVALGDKVKTYYASEIDKNAIQIAQKNFPSTKQLGDVKSIKEGTIKEPIDLLIGGSPCTDLSIAKKGRKGLEGDHSKLFYEYIRVLNLVKPKYFILENVASMKQKDKDIITEKMGVQPILIDSALVSAQSRKRLFWTNIPNVQQPEDRKITLQSILQKDEEIPDELIIYREDQMTKIKIKPPKANTPQKVGFVEPHVQGNNVYSTDGKSSCITANGGGKGANSGLYLIKSEDKGMSIRGRQDASGNWIQTLDVRKDDKVSALTSSCSGKLALVGRVVNRRLDKDGKRHDGDQKVPQTKQIEERADGKCGTLTSVQKDNVVLEKDSQTIQKIRKLTPVECERLQCLPDNYTEGISKTARYRAIGNGFNVEVIKHIINQIPR